jgi:hypothetical protein
LVLQEEIITNFANEIMKLNPNFDVNNFILLKDEISLVRDSIVKSNFKFDLSLDDNTKFESDYKYTMDISEEEKPNDDFDNDSKRLGV